MNATKMNELFKEEIKELWRRYKEQNKKPEYFPYNRIASTPEELVTLGFEQMTKSPDFIQALYQNNPHQGLTFDQWIVFEWFSKSLKGDEQNIFNKASLL